MVVSDSSFLWWLSSCNKSKISIDSFLRYWPLKIPEIWLDKRYTWPHSTKIGSLTFYLFLTTVKKLLTMQKILFPVIWIIKKSWNLIGQRSTTDQSQPKGLVSCYLCLMPNFMQKANISLDPFQRFWLLKNHAVWRIEGHNWQHPSRSSSLRLSLLLRIISMLKIQGISWLPTEILMIKEYCHLISSEHFRS